MFTPELEAEERRHRIISGTLTTIIMAILLLLSLIWTAYRERIPPPGGDYEVLGAIDFGNYTQGSRQVNNFERPVEDPAETPQPEAARPVQTPQVAETSPPPVKEITTEAPSPVTQPPPPKEVKNDPIPKPTTTVKPAEPKKEPTETQNDTGTAATSSKPTTDPVKPSDKPSGSNHGDATSGTGNAGTPDVKTLDPSGLYTFGTGGDGGLKGRSPVSLPYPVYDVQEEGELTFEFLIDRSGNVAHVKLIGLTDKPGLRKAGMDAIKKWRFTAAAAGQGEDLTPVRVKIRFKLKG